jgi:Tfp pilus assembly protein PilX
MKVLLFRQIMKILEGNKGMVLPTALMFMGVLALLGTTAFVTTTTDMKIGGNHKISEQAFYAVQAGGEEARARLKANAIHPVHDGYPTQTQWRAYVGSLEKTKETGYNSGNSMHARYDSIASDLGYTVQIRHQTDTAGSILYWGDADGDGVHERNTTAGENIYVVTSYGSTGGSNKYIETEMTRMPAITVPSALYVEATTTIQGSNTYVIGVNACGSTNKAGIVTTENPGSVTFLANPHVTGVGGGEPNIAYNGTDMDVQSVVDSWKGLADFSYTVGSTTHSATSQPGPGDAWGTPTPGSTLQDPSSCSCSNIVHYDTGGTYIQLSGGVSGCGILLIEGDLDVHGDFSWYGPVLVTGSVVFTGGGNKNITGALIAGGSAVVDVTGGNANIIYCSSAISDQTRNRPLRLLGWKEDM